MSSSEISRRKAIQFAAAGAAGAIAAPYFVRSSALAAPGKPGANDRVIIGFIGVTFYWIAWRTMRRMQLST